MPAPGTFTHKVMTGLHPRRHYNPGDIHNALVSSGNRIEARRLAAPFGIEPGTTGCPVHVLKAIDESLSGKRSDLTPSIRQMLSEEMESDPIRVEPVSIEFIRHMGLDLPTLILLSIINKATSSAPGSPDYSDVMDFTSHDGSDRIEIMMFKESHASPPCLTAMTMSIAENTSWSLGRIQTRGIPLAAVTQINGRPLTHLVSHPVLDPHHYRITAHFVHNDGGIDILTDHVRSYVDMPPDALGL